MEILYCLDHFRSYCLYFIFSVNKSLALLHNVFTKLIYICFLCVAIVCQLSQNHKTKTTSDKVFLEIMTRTAMKGGIVDMEGNLKKIHDFEVKNGLKSQPLIDEAHDGPSSPSPAASFDGILERY